MQSRDSKGRFVPGGGMSEDTRKKIGQTQIKRRKEAREFGTPPDKKKCTGKCGRFLPVEDNFLKIRKKLPSGEISFRYESQCNKCRLEKRAEAREKNREKLRLSERKRYQANRDKICADARERHRIKMGLQGKTVVPLKKYRHEVGGRMALVPVEPFVEWFNSLNGSRPTEDVMGEALARAVRRATGGEVQRIHLDIVDEMGVLAGVNHLIHALYPDI